MSSGLSLQAFPLSWLKVERCSQLSQCNKLSCDVPLLPMPAGPVSGTVQIGPRIADGKTLEHIQVVPRCNNELMVSRVT